jgi:dUTP pyrophosphatase
MFLFLGFIATLIFMWKLIATMDSSNRFSIEESVANRIAELENKFNELDAYVDNLKEYVLNDESVLLGVKQLHPDATLPSYAHPGDSGMDIKAIETFTIAPGETKLVKTGIAMAIPKGYEIQVRPRSGLSLNTKLRVSNSPGTVDSNYKGEICIIMENTGWNYSGDIVITSGHRIAQLVLAKVETAAVGWVNSLEESNRNSDGFGSSGVN